MAIIQRTKLVDVLASMPELETFRPELINKSKSNCLVLAAGFEPRSDWLLDNSDLNQFDTVVLITYPESNTDFLGKAQDHRNVKTVLFDEKKLDNDLRNLLREISEGNDGAINFMLDVSAMSSITIYSAMSALVDGDFEKDDLSIVYCEARSYRPLEEEWKRFLADTAETTDTFEFAEAYCQEHFQTTGVSSVLEFPRFAGRNEGPSKTKVIAIPNFGLERMKAMLAHCEELYGAVSSDPYWIFGSPPSSANAWRLESLKRLYNSSLDSMNTTASTRNYKELIRLLDDIYLKDRNVHYVVATTGSKMQHIGTYFFLLMRPDVGLMLSRPEKYNVEGYSQEKGPQWHLNFGNLGEVKARLSKIDKLNFVWEK